MFVGYTMTTKQYRLYNPKTRAFIKSLDVVFYEDTPFFQQTTNEIFLPFTNDSEEEAGPATRSKATRFCSVMPRTRDSDSRNSRPSRNTPERQKPDDPIQALQDVLQRSRARRSLALAREASTEAGPADGYGTPVVRNRKKPPMPAAEKHEKTVNALRTGLGKYWEGRGISKSYEAEKERVEMIQNPSPPVILLRKQEQRLKSEMKRKMKMTSHSLNPISSSWSTMDQTPLRRR